MLNWKQQKTHMSFGACQQGQLAVPSGPDWLVYMSVQVARVEPGTPSQLLYLLHHHHCPGPGKFLLQRSNSVWLQWLVSITAVRGLPGIHKGVLPEYLGAKEGQVSFCSFHSEGHTCPSSDAGTPNITIGVLLECGDETLPPYSSPYPRHASSWTSGAPADIKN